ncbi:MAG: 50S ribosomal protein L30e [Methanomicrobiales archaeon]|nr:50S ribosomal protein L30e [Methanomicrobiales archaeon]
MDFNVSLRKAIKTGDVILGQNKTQDTIQQGKARLVILAKNSSGSFQQLVTHNKGLLVYIYEGTSTQLGKACGKPFLVSALAILDPGESDILSLKET